MSFFSKVLEKVGIKPVKADSESVSVGVLSESSEHLDVTVAGSSNTVSAEVDVVALLNEMAESSAEKLNWKTSIVDLLKLLKLDSSIQARRELAVELECPEDKLSDSAQMNMWLHKEVLKRIAANGGNIPSELL